MPLCQTRNQVSTLSALKSTQQRIPASSAKVLNRLVLVAKRISAILPAATAFISRQKVLREICDTLRSSFLFCNQLAEA